MRIATLGLLFCSGLLACSGRYERNPTSDGVGAETGVGAGAATGSGGHGGQDVTGPDPSGGAAVSGGSSSVAGTAAVAGAPPQLVDAAACGVPVGQPEAIAAPIADSMLWWTRLSKLIWGEPGHAPPNAALPISIGYKQAGQIADAAVEQAIGETKGIPGVEPFVRRWLRLGDQSAPLVVDWNGALAAGPALDALLLLSYDKTRVGAFTEPAFLAERPTISWRGTVLLEALFAQTAPPEPPGLPPFVPPAGLTRREGLMQAVANPACAACHQLIDPLGFSLENYDEYGKFVSFDAGKPVDASGSYRLFRSGGELTFKDIVDLSQQLASTCDANLGLADRFYMFAVESSEIKIPMGDAYEPDRARLRQAFMRSGRTYRSLIKGFAQSQAIRVN